MKDTEKERQYERERGWNRPLSARSKTISHTGSTGHSTLPISSHLRGSPMAENQARRRTGGKLTKRCWVISTDKLPDDILLAIFHSYLDEYSYEKHREEAWQSLVHVCYRWRSIVFGSPRHLNLQLVCTGGTRARDMLDIWTALPLIIQCDEYHQIESVDNIIAVLEHTDRVFRIDLRDVRNSDLETILAAMQEPLPELTYLQLLPAGKAPVVHDSFLGGSAPRLESLRLSSLPFPGLPKLLSSATHLNTLYLESIPHSGYISPNMMVTALSALTSLGSLTLGFRSPQSCPDRASRRPPPSTRPALPLLTEFCFKGVSEYLDDLVAHVDTPQLNFLFITFFNNVVFEAPQLIQFISRTPTLSSLNKAHISLWNHSAYVNFLSQTSDHRELTVKILRRGLNWQVSSLKQVCTLCLPFRLFSTLEDLYIYKRPHSPLDWKYKIENGQWLDLLHPFTVVKSLYLCKEFAPRIGPALQELVEGRTAEVLPTLQNIFLEGLKSSGPIHECIGQFVAARQVADHPIDISFWANSEKDMIFGKYVD